MRFRLAPSGTTDILEHEPQFQTMLERHLKHGAEIKLHIVETADTGFTDWARERSKTNLKPPPIKGNPLKIMYVYVYLDQEAVDAKKQAQSESRKKAEAERQAAAAAEALAMMRT